MKIRSRAPLRIGLAGGGTDLPSYSDQFGGVVFNAAIGMYAYCTIIPTNDNRIKIISYDNKNDIDTESVPFLEIDDDNTLILHKGIYNRIVKDYNGGKPLSFVMSTSNDAPIGSGLGTSSTMVAAVFGGFNLMEFKTDGTTVVNSLRLDKSIINELECSILLYYSGTSRKSADQQKELAKNIINDQIARTSEKKTETMDAMKSLKESAHQMKECVLMGNFTGFADCLKRAWEYKKKTSSIISNKHLEQTINYALENGAEAVKVSGAGGGGFLMLYCDPINRQKLIYAMEKLPGKVYTIKFSKNGTESWITD